MAYYSRDLALVHACGFGQHGVRATVGTGFGAAELPPGMRAVTGVRN